MADYIKFYGFSEDPFADKPDPKFFFLAGSHNEALLSLQYGINERKGFMLLLGERGIGKTTLIHYLTGAVGEKVRIVFIPHSNIPYPYIEMLKEILHQLNKSPKHITKGSMLHELYYHLMKSLEHDENVAIILDEAHHIEESVVEEVRLLANLETSASKLLQIVLCGEPQLKDKLHADIIRQIGQRIVITSHIKPMTAEESFQYIDHRLKIVGSAGSNVFTDEAVSAICKKAGGISRIINVLCSNALSVACALGEEKVSIATVRKIRNEKDIMNNQALQTRISRIQNPLSRKVFAAIAVFMVLGFVAFFGKDHIKSILNRYPAVARQTVLEREVKQEHAEQKTIPKATAPEIKPAEIHPVKTQPQPLAPVKQPDVAIRVKTIVEATRGVSLSFLALKYCNKVNTTIIDYILDMNPSITNPDLILVNQKIKLPEISEDMLIRQTTEGAFRIHLATFTSRSSAAQYSRGIVLEGKAIEIVNRNVSAGETWYRVMAGPYVDRREASKALREMTKQGLLSSFYGDMRR